MSNTFWDGTNVDERPKYYGSELTDILADTLYNNFLISYTNSCYKPSSEIDKAIAPLIIDNKIYLSTIKIDRRTEDGVLPFITDRIRDIETKKNDKAIIISVQDISKNLVTVQNLMIETAREQTMNNTKMFNALLSEGVKHRVYMIYSNGGKAITVLTNKITEHFMLKLVAMLPALVIDKSSLTIPFDEEMYAALGALDKPKFDERWNIWYAQIKKTLFLAETKKRLEPIKKLDQLEIKNLENKIKRAKDTIEEYNKSTIDLIKIIEETQMILLQTKLNSEKNRAEEFVEYILKHKLNVLSNFRYDERYTTLSFDIKTPCNNYDPEILKVYFKSERENCVSQAPEYIQDLLKEVFIDQKYILYMGASVQLNLKTTQPFVNVYDSNKKIEDAVPNTHIMSVYNCWGNNKTPILKAIATGEYIIALEQTIQAIGSLNFTDTTIFNEFIYNLNGSNRYRLTKSLVEVETGRKLSIKNYQDEWRKINEAV